MKSLYSVKILYKKDIPLELVWFVQSNDGCNIMKNGITRHGNVNLIAATVIVEDLNKRIDVNNNPKLLIKNLKILIEGLVANGQLVDSI